MVNVFGDYLYAFSKIGSPAGKTFIEKIALNATEDDLKE